MTGRTREPFPRQAMQQLLDLLYPPRCVGCQRSGYVLCSTCLARIPRLQRICQRCSAPLSAAGECLSCQSASLRLSGLCAVSTYSEPLRSYIHALKYAGNTRLAQPLGVLLVETMLIRHRATLSQVGLQHWERQQNVQEAFSCSPAFAGGQLRGRSILLVDDVSTSASTLEACAAPLFAAGAAAVFGLVLARSLF